MQKQSRLQKEELLKRVVATLQGSVERGKMTSEVVSRTVEELKTIGHKYDSAKYPRLRNTNLFIDESTDTPCNLAEALLWKLGKWPGYKKFARQFTDDNSQPSNTDAVLYLAARHLKNGGSPIMDQHALRAMWAICSLNREEKRSCKAFLLRRDKWKGTGSGTSAVACYYIFLKYMDKMASAGATKCR